MFEVIQSRIAIGSRLLKTKRSQEIAETSPCDLDQKWQQIAETSLSRFLRVSLYLKARRFGDDQLGPNATVGLSISRW